MKNVGRFYPAEIEARSNQSDYPRQSLGSQVSLLHSMRKTGNKNFKKKRLKNLFFYLNSQGESEEADRTEADQEVERGHEEQT